MNNKQVDLKELLNSIKDKYPTAEDSFAFFETFSSKKELGIVSIDKNNQKFDIRGENTPSTKPYARLSFIDYGGEGERRDVISLICDNTKLNFPNAVKLLAEWHNEDISELMSNSKGLVKTVFQEKAKPYTRRYIDSQIHERNLPENKEIFNEILSGLFRTCSKKETIAGIKAFEIGLNSYDRTIEVTENDEIVEKKEKQYRLFIPEYDENKVPFGSYRYNRGYKDNKGLLRKNCKRVLFGSHLIKFFKKDVPIIMSEGHSDVVVNISKYMQCLTTGSSTSKLTPFLHLLKGFTLHFYPDADQPGFKGVTLKILEIEKFNQTLPEEEKVKYQVFLWSKAFKEKDIDDFKQFCLPLSYIKESDSFKKYSKKWWLNHFRDDNLSSTIDMNIIKQEQKIIIEKKQRETKEEFIIPEGIWVENWKPLSKEILPQGFDFIDFHEKFENSTPYLKFISNYKFK